VEQLTEAVVRGLLRSRPSGGTFHIEDVQDQVELGLMRFGHHEIARAYVLYRERRAQERAKAGQAPAVVHSDTALREIRRTNSMITLPANVHRWRMPGGGSQ
jgi:ribonucleoside-diphosphate reductase alpha chain